MRAFRILYATGHPTGAVIGCASVALAILGLIYVVISGRAQIPSAQAATASPTATPIVVWSIDVDPSTSGVQASRTVTVGQQFSVDLVLNPYSGPPWNAYGDIVSFDDVALDGLGTGSNLASFATAADCGSSLEDEDDTGTARFGVSCLDAALATTAYSGPMTEFTFRCEHPGVAALNLVSPEVYLQEANPKAPLIFPTAVNGASITCSGTAPPTAS